MLRASKALLAVVAVEVGLAMRRDKTGTTPNVLDALGVLLEASSSKHAAVFAKIKDELRLASEARVTPGATESLNEILNQIIADLDSGVNAKILSGVSDTQAAIDQKVADLTTATTEALSRKTTADNDDLTWVTCVGDEQAKLVVVEAAQLAYDQANESMTQLCQHQADIDVFSFTPSISLEFECSLGAGSCATQIASYTTQVNNMLNGFEEDSQAATTSWNDAKVACDTAHEDVWEKAATLAAAENDFHTKRSLCLENHEARQLGMCLFGESLQQKCAKIAPYNQLIADVDQVNGGVYSQPDREAEWQTVEVTKCMLNKVIAGLDLTSTGLQECDDSSSAGLPAIDRKEAAFAEQTSAANFNCEEETITFTGESWETPEFHADSKASEYKKISFVPPVNLVDPPAFSFCT